jgi:hypothetical protein
MKDDPEHKKLLGLIAQEVQRECPGLVDEDENGILSVKSSVVLMKLLGAFGEHVNETRRRH